ncbi:MAG: DsbA family oxidoreductase [Pseudomonadota bacterium]
MQIEIFSDVICPWCFIGKRRLDAVLGTSVGDDVEVRWRPYLLYPNLPREGVNRGDWLRRRYGEGADPGRIPERIRAEAEAEGIELRFDLIQYTPNTLLAHQLLEFAYIKERQHELAEALFIAYFCKGQDMGDLDTLLSVAANVGLDEEGAREYLSSESGLAEVQYQLERAPELGISGVPGYYLASSFLLPGAQSAETMTQILTRVKNKLASRA